MPRISVPDGPEHTTTGVYALRPEYAAPAAMMREAVVKHSILPVRLREAARFRVAQINGCLICREHRDPKAVAAGFTNETYAAVEAAATSGLFSLNEKLAIEFTERFLLDHHSLDDAFFERLHEQFSDAEIVDLTFFVARYLAFGRLTHTLGLDDSCELAAVIGDR